jgi:hypothetical protein
MQVNRIYFMRIKSNCDLNYIPLEERIFAVVDLECGPLFRSLESNPRQGFYGYRLPRLPGAPQDS